MDNTTNEVYKKSNKLRLIILILPIIFIIILFTAVFAIYINAHKYVISYGSTTKTVRLYPGTVQKACEKAGFEDLLVAEQAESGGITYLTLASELHAQIERGSEKITVSFLPCTVEELLCSNGIILNENETTTPDLKSNLTTNTQIIIHQLSQETQVEIEQTDFRVTTKENDDLPDGMRKIAQNGIKGQIEKTYNVEYKGGEEVSRTLVSEKVLSKPVDCILEIGTGKNKTEVEILPEDEGIIYTKPVLPPNTDGSDPLLGAWDGTLSIAGRENVWSAPTSILDDTKNQRLILPDGTTYEYTRQLIVKATAYNRLEEGGLITATGTTTKYGTVAVDPKVIELGSRVFVVAEDGTSWSYGPGVAEDTGGLIKGNKIDLFFMTATEASTFGVRSAKIYILE